jgi:lipopolysaccharide export system permease protein
MFKFNQKLIFNKFFIDSTYFFFTLTISISLIVWVIQAVNFLDFVVEDGHGLEVYFKYTLLNLPKIISRLIPFVFFISLFYIINQYEDSNELKIFWLTGINKMQFINFIICYAFIIFIILLSVSLYLVPASQDKARSYVKSSKIEFFPSLINEKRFVDTVDKLTIFIEKKNYDNSYENIYLKDTSQNNSKIIYAKKGKLINNINERYIALYDGKLITINKNNITTFNFETTTLNLNNYFTKSITLNKIQERSISSLLFCYYEFHLLKKKEYFDPTLCNDPAIKEIEAEIFKRTIKPLYIFLLALNVCFLLLYSKENFLIYKKRIIIFFVGFTIIILSEISSSLLTKNILSTVIMSILPIVLSIISYLILFLKSKKNNYVIRI